MPSPRSYREVLYSRYSESFGDQKAYDYRIALQVFEAEGRLPHLPKDAMIADVGCGKGEWLAWLQSYGFTRVRGFDVSAGELTFARGIEVECGDIFETLSANRWRGQFALIHAKDLIEHFTKQETLDFLFLCHTALAEEGELWISTFNAQGIFSGATRYGDFTHESGFSPASLAQVLRATGFEVKEVAATHVCPRSIGGIARRWLWKLIEKPAEMILRARHGGRPNEKVDLFSVRPDLFAVGRKTTPGDSPCI